MIKQVPEALIEFAGQLAEASAAVIRQYFRAGIGIEIKPDKSPVTIADVPSTRGASSSKSPRSLTASSALKEGRIFGSEHSGRRSRKSTDAPNRRRSRFC